MYYFFKLLFSEPFLKKNWYFTLKIHDENSFQSEANSYYKCQCYPLGSLLLALNVTQVDLFSLDVEFVEEEVIKNFDFEKFNVQVISFITKV